jgi:fluoride exporter
MTWLAVLLGGALGSVARHAVNIASPRLFGSSAPFATAIVNMIGALLIGVLAGAMAAQRLSMSPAERAFVFTGLLGGFTTFSSFMFDSHTLWQGGSPGKALVNLGGQLLIGFALMYAGYRLAGGQSVT